MSLFLPESFKDTHDLTPAAEPDPERAQRDIVEMQRVLKTAARYPTLIPQEFQALMVDSMQVSNLILPANQVVGFPTLYRVYDRNKDNVAAENTTSETTMYSKSLNEGDLGEDRALRLTLFGSVVYNNNTANTLRFRCSYGSTLFFDWTTGPGVLNASSRAWIWEVFVQNLGTGTGAFGSTTLRLGVSGSVGTTTTGLGSFGDVFDTNAIAVGGSSGIGMASLIEGPFSTEIKATVQWSDASANNQFRKRFAVLELI